MRGECPPNHPNTTASEVKTAVTVPDGSTIILGGLLKLNQNNGGKKVPLLGDVPPVGGLFRSANTSDKQSKLYVFVKAEIDAITRFEIVPRNRVLSAENAAHSASDRLSEEAAGIGRRHSKARDQRFAAKIKT